MKKSYFNKSIWLASLGCLLTVAVACGDDDDSTSPEPTGGTKAQAGTDAGGKTGTGGKTGGGGTTGTAGKDGTAGKTSEPVGGGGAGNEPPVNEGGAGGEAACTDDTDNGCFLIGKCKPTKREDFLNACPTTGCQGFDNKKLTSIKAVKPQSL